MGFPSSTSGKELACQFRRCKRHRFDPWIRKIPLEEGTATHSSILAWRIPQTEQPTGLQTIVSQRVRHDWSDLACLHYPLQSFSTIHLCSALFFFFLFLSSKRIYILVCFYLWKEVQYLWQSSSKVSILFYYLFSHL